MILAAGVLVSSRAHIINQIEELAFLVSDEAGKNNNSYIFR